MRCREKGDLPSAPEKPQLRPKSVHLKVTPEVYALFREARKVLSDERNGEVTDSELLEAMCRRIVDPGTPESGPSHQVAYKQCPNCKQAKVTGAGRDFDITPSEFERAACDSVVIGNLDAPTPERVVSTVPPRLRTQVFARDGGRCVVPGCRSSRWLQVHHILSRAQGGPHELWNLCLLCWGHHTALHDGRLLITGRAPDELRIRWAYGEPLPPGLTPLGRIAELRRRDELVYGAAMSLETALHEVMSTNPKSPPKRDLLHPDKGRVERAPPLLYVPRGTRKLR